MCLKRDDLTKQSLNRPSLKRISVLLVAMVELKYSTTSQSPTRVVGVPLEASSSTPRQIFHSCSRAKMGFRPGIFTGTDERLHYETAH